MQNFQSDKSFGDFTRRKNWSQSILDSIRDVLHVLSNDLHIIYSSDASSQILGYRPSELVGHSFLEFLHMDDVDFFLRDFKQVQNTSQTVRISYRFRRKDGNYATLETRGQFHKSYFFGNARRLPTETSRSIDSILDLKMENELLKRQLEALQRTDQNLEFEQTANESLVYTQGVDPSFDVAESLSLFTGLNYDMGERSYGISSGLVGGELKSIETLQKSKKYVTTVVLLKLLNGEKALTDQRHFVMLVVYAGPRNKKPQFETSKQNKYHDRKRSSSLCLSMSKT